MLSEYLIALTVLISIVGTLLPSIMESPATPLLNLFFVQGYLQLAFVFLALFFFAREIEEREGPYALGILYALALGIGMFTGAKSLPFGATDALLGALIALDPYAVVLFEFFPVPVIVAAGALLAIKLLVGGPFDIVPLLFGIAYGYLALGAFRKASEPAKPAYRRY